MSWATIVGERGGGGIPPKNASGLPSLVNQTVFRERACARERGRGGRKNTVWPNWPGFRGISYLASRSRCDQSDYWYAVVI